MYSRLPAEILDHVLALVRPSYTITFEGAGTSAVHVVVYALPYFSSSPSPALPPPELERRQLCKRAERLRNIMWGAYGSNRLIQDRYDARSNRMCKNSFQGSDLVDLLLNLGVCACVRGLRTTAVDMAFGAALFFCCSSHAPAPFLALLG